MKMNPSVSRDTAGSSFDITSGRHLEVVRRAYESSGESFRYLVTPDPDIGYFVEPWTNQCLTGPTSSPDQPKPVSLDESDDEITAHENAIRTWIADAAHAIVVTGIIRQAPADWCPIANLYETDWFEAEFGASVVVFQICGKPLLPDAGLATVLVGATIRESQKLNSPSQFAEAPPAAPPPVRDDTSGGSERERLLTTWRLHPRALVDLESPAVEGGPNDGGGVVSMTDKTGNEIDEFCFGSADEADEAVDYALRQLNPGR